MRVLFFLFFCVSTVQSQKTLLKGSVIDSETKQPVVYANISFLKSNKGTSSNEDGTFSLEINKELLNHKAHISCLNYKDTIVLAKALNNKTVLLKRKDFLLDEVLITAKKNQELVVDKYRRKHIKSSFGANQANPCILTKYFRYEDTYEDTPFLKNVIVYFGSYIGRKKSKFRVRLYAIDPVTKNPSEDIIKDDIVAYSRKVDGKVVVDISKYNIEFPKEGFYVGLERLHIPYNFYEYTYTEEGKRKKHVSKSVAPNFGTVYSKDTIKVFLSGKWRSHYYAQDFYKGNSIQPAISLTLSN